MKLINNTDDNAWLDFFKDSKQRIGYAKREILAIYELARFSLENGDFHRAEALFLGLTRVAADFIPAWLGLTYVHIKADDKDAAFISSRTAFQINPECMEALLFYISCLLSVGDVNTAGTQLGEVADKLESGITLTPSLSRFYRLQMARYQQMV